MIEFSAETDRALLESIQTSCARVRSDASDVFIPVLMLTTLPYPNAGPLFADVRDRYRQDANALKALDAFEAQFRAALEAP